MDYGTILAQAAESTSSATSSQGIIPLDLFWEYITPLFWKYITSLKHLEALTFISFGVVWLMYGWRTFKILVL